MFGQGFNYGFLGKPPCFTDTTDIFKDNSGVALYTLDYDASAAPIIAGSIVDNNSLKLNLDATNTSSYSGSGTAWNDLTTNNYDATLVSSPGYTTANGGAFDFDGSSDYATLNSNAEAAISSLSKGTIEIWARPDNISSGFGRKTMFGTGHTTADNRWMLFRLHNSNGLQLSMNNSGTSTTIASTNYGTLNEWNHYVVTYDGNSTYAMYVNGIPQTISISGSAGNIWYNDIATNTLEVAKFDRGSSGSFYDPYDGEIAQIRVYDDALTASQVLENYGATRYNYVNYNGTPTDVTFGVGGQINYGARFNGSSSKITTSLDFDTLTDYTVSMWIYIDATPSATDFFAGTINGSSFNGFYFAIESDNEIRFYERNASNTITALKSTDTVNVGSWNHIVAVRDGNTNYLYINNGTPVSASNSTITHEAGFTLGRAGSYNTGLFDGKIDQVRIFSKVLSSSEVSTLYAETACVYTCTTDTVNYPSGTTPVAYYKFDNSAEDETGSYDGTINGTVDFNFGRFGQSAKIGGASSDYINLGTISELPTNTQNTVDFSWSGWVKATNAELNATSGSNFFFGHGKNSYQFIGFGGNVNGNFPTGRISYYTYGGSGYHNSWIQSSSTYSDGSWHHVVVTDKYNSGTDNRTRTLYVDNVQVAQDTVDKQFSNSASLTTISTSDTNAYGGYIDQVRIYSSALTDSQVSQLYNEKQCLDTVTEPTGNLRFDEFWAGYDDGQTNRAEFKSSGQIVDFNTYSEGHAVLNQNAQTSGKYYLEIKLVGTSGHDGFGVFNRSTNTIYDSGSPFGRQKNPVDGNYGATLYAQGSIVYVGNVSQSGFTNLSLGAGDIVCMAVNVDEKRIWWGRRDGLSDLSITWNSGNPNGGYGGLEVGFVPSDVIVAHVSETSSRYSEFEVLNHADMLEPPFNFSYLDGPNTASLTENESNF